MGRLTTAAHETLECKVPVPWGRPFREIIPVCPVSACQYIRIYLVIVCPRSYPHKLSGPVYVRLFLYRA